MLAVAAAAVLALAASAAAQQAKEGRNGRVRVIAPSLITAPQFNPDSLERIAPRAPLHSSATSAQEAEDGEGTILFRPVASAAGRFSAQGHTITIAGIRILEPHRACGSPDGATWPCGMRARTAFRSWLRGRAVTCDLAGARRVAGAEVASCALAGQDMGAWLVSNGWALADPEGPYLHAGKAAREARRGIFGDGRTAR